MLGGLFAASLAAFLVYGPRLDASTSGFALSQAISFSSMILVSSILVSKSGRMADIRHSGGSEWSTRWKSKETLSR